MAYNVWGDEVLYPADLNENFSLITAVLHSITGGQFAADAINAGTIIADDIVDETHMNYAATVNALRCLQIGKATGTHQQLMLKGTSLLTAANTTNTDVEIAYANADIASGGDPVYLAAPHVYVTVVTDLGDAAQDLGINVKAHATDTCLVNIDLPSTDTFTQNWTLYWTVLGDI